MKNSIIVVFALFSIFLKAQIEADKADTLLDAMCTNFQQSANLNDSVRIQILNEKYISPYLEKFSDSVREEKIEHLYFRFQKRCENFRDFLRKSDPPIGNNWIQLNTEPIITVSDGNLEKFKKHANFYYFEYSGEKTLVKTDSKFWKEIFADGTSSKLLYKWIDKYKFELEFIESDNISRKNFSKKGDKYIYGVISREENYYWVYVEIPGQSEKFKFKLFLN